MLDVVVCSGCNKERYRTSDYFYEYPDGTLTDLCKGCHAKYLSKKNNWSKNNMQVYACRSDVDLVKRIDIRMTVVEARKILADFTGDLDVPSKIVTSVSKRDLMDACTMSLDEIEFGYKRDKVIRDYRWRLVRNILVDFADYAWPKHPHPELVNHGPRRYKRPDGPRRKASDGSKNRRYDTGIPVEFKVGRRQFGGGPAGM